MRKNSTASRNPSTASPSWGDGAGSSDTPFLVLPTRFLADHAIPGSDLTGELRPEARRRRQLYYRVSGLLNEEGNRVAAAAIARCHPTPAGHGVALRPTRREER